MSESWSAAMPREARSIAANAKRRNGSHRPGRLHHVDGEMFRGTPSTTRIGARRTGNRVELASESQAIRPLTSKLQSGHVRRSPASASIPIPIPPATFQVWLEQPSSGANPPRGRNDLSRLDPACDQVDSRVDLLDALFPDRLIGSIMREIGMPAHPKSIDALLDCRFTDRGIET